MSIEVKRINSYNIITEFTLSKDNSIYFYGQLLDNRSKISHDYFKENVKDICKVLYHEKEFSISITSTFDLKLEKNKIKNHTIGNDLIAKLHHTNIYLDATSLGFAEILLLLHNINIYLQKAEVKIVYAEPLEYRLKKQDDTFNTEFDLTSKSNDFMKIPPYSLLIDSVSDKKAELIVFLGFENDRLGRIIEHDEKARYKKYTPILAVPAFVPGWENISLRRHYLELNNFDNIQLAPANNPYEVNEVLINIQQNSKLENIIIAPIGTKPHSIGAIIFLINSKERGENVGIVYDFPEKKENRTDGVGKIHEYSLCFKN